MFFTIIIPAYKCLNTIDRLLNSIKQQDTNDLKVLIIDDSSDKNHFQSLQKYTQNYSKYFQIECFERENDIYTIHCPGNTRHAGLKLALQEDTEYILFIDCDDELKFNTLGKLKQTIKKFKNPLYVSTAFEQYDDDNNERFLGIESGIPGWLHGKCFNKQFLIQYDIQFKIDMETHQDIYFTFLAQYNLEDKRDLKIDLEEKLIFYKWHIHRDSASHEKLLYKDNKTFFNKYFNNHLISIIDTIFKIKITNKTMFQSLYIQCSSNLIKMFLYYQAIGDTPKNYKLLKIRFQNYFKFFNTTKEQFIKFVYNNPQLYNTNRNRVFKEFQSEFVEQISLKNFIQNL